MKRLIGSMLVAGLLASGPVLAGGGHGHGHGHWKHDRGHAQGHGHWGHGRGHYREHVVVREYWQPAPVYRPVPVYPRPVYYRPAPPPGVHIVLPGVYIPWR